VNLKEKDNILNFYGEINNEYCGPWNTSLQSKWYDYEIAKYFEEHFQIEKSLNVCNVGIGTGYWDRYLSFRMNKEAKLVSVDIDSDITETFRLCLINEQNKRNIEIVNEDILKYNSTEKFDIITIIGSTVKEIGKYEETLKKIISMIKKDGSIFYSSVDKSETKENIETVLKYTNFKLTEYIRLEEYGICLIHSKIVHE